MWFAKMFFAMVVLAAVCYFAIINSGQMVSLTVFPGKQPYELSLVLALFGAFVLGAFIIFLFSLFRDVRSRASLSKLRRENARLSEELTALRNLPLEEPEAHPEAARENERPEE